MEPVVIQNLLNKPFSRRDAAAKNELLKSGRPTPKINLTQSVKIKGQQYVRHFQESIYEKFKWIAGCAEQNKLYCWPCLLFDVKDRDKNVWVVQGYDDLSHLHKAAKKHESTQNHINSVITYKTFGTVRKDLLMLHKQKQSCIVTHNENVTKNRNILKRLIDAVCYLAKQECALSVNQGNYIELLNLISKYDELLTNHLNNETNVFSGTSNSGVQVQNDIIASINHVILSEIKREVRETPFVAIMLDETSDISHKSQLCVVFRYINYSGVPVERFVLFEDVSADRSSNALSKFVLKTISNWHCENKLIAQTYDGAVVMAAELNDTQTKVTDVYPQSMFVHCSAHVLNIVLSQSVLYIKECKLFFATISGMASFFSVSTKRNNGVSETVKKRFPKLATTKWNNASRLVNIIKDQRQSLCELFESIIENPESWDNETINMAKGYDNFFEEFNSQFLLTIFAKVFSYTDVLFNVPQKSSLDIEYSIKKINKVKTDLKDMRNSSNFDEIYNDTVSIVGVPNLNKKRRHTEIQHFKQLYNDILDTLYNQIEVRFEKLSSLKFVELLNSKFFSNYRNKFPDDCLDSLKDSYAKYFDVIKLANELRVLYRSESFINMNLSQLIQHIKDHDLTDALSEVNRLAYLICTIPFTSATVERSFSALNRIKTYTRNTMGQDRLSNLALITIEKKLLCYLQSKSDFYENVITDFVNSTDRGIDLIYK